MSDEPKAPAEKVAIISLLRGILGHQINISGQNELVTMIQIAPDDYGHSIRIETLRGDFNESIYPKK